MVKKKKEKWQNYKVYYQCSNNLRLKGKKLVIPKDQACFSSIINKPGKYVHHILTPEILEMETVANIKAIVAEFKKFLPSTVIYYERKNLIIRIEKQNRYNFNMLLCNFIRNIYYRTNKELLKNDLYYAGLRGKTNDICPSEDGLYRLLYYQNKAIGNTKYGRGDHNILYKKCKLYTFDEVKEIYQNSNITTQDLLKDGE
jgi:hypothetical protein